MLMYDLMISINESCIGRYQQKEKMKVGEGGKKREEKMKDDEGGKKREEKK
jgi:hypothetical protein